MTMFYILILIGVYFNYTYIKVLQEHIDKLEVEVVELRRKVKK
jgi:hypothetical protein